MIKLILCGAGGRMGREILNYAADAGKIAVVAGIEARGHGLIGKKIGRVPISDDLLAHLDDCDCVVDFSSPRATIENLRRAERHNRPWVIGTTGFTPRQRREIARRSKKFPVLVAANMSIGVNQLYNLVRAAAFNLKTYDVEIVETHHRAKKDAPSGTALALAGIVKECRPAAGLVFGRQGTSLRKNEIGISVVRGGDVAGEHRVLFMHSGEFLELRHFATSRRCFAEGTIRAVRFLLGKKRGLYSMADLVR